jgi:hypothetical protein
MRPQRDWPGRRVGFVLPLVLALVAASTVGFYTLSTSAWRAQRHSRSARATLRVQLAADEALAAGVVALPVESLTSRPLGASWSRSTRISGNIEVTERWLRTAPMTAWLLVQTREQGSTTLGPSPPLQGVAAERTMAHVLRALWLRPPEWPMSAALSTTGTVDLSQGGVVRGSGGAADSSGCAREWHTGAAAVRSAMGDTLAQPLDRAVQEMQARAAPWRVSDGTPGPTVGGQNGPPWRARAMNEADTVLAGPVAFRGVLLRDGLLRITGDVDVEGLLIVRGPLRLEGARVRVRGAVVLADPLRRAVELPAGVAVAWDRCAIDMALATVAQPVSTPFRLWHAVTP